MNQFLDTSEWLELETLEEIQSLSMLVLESCVELSPVDEGRLRGNWVASVNSESAAQFDEKNRDAIGVGRGVIYSHKSNISYVMIQNNLPYASVADDGLYPDPVKRGSWDKELKEYVKLSENGYSKQAPDGITRPAMQAAIRRMGD